MKDDDYVETSDVEELEEIRALDQSDLSHDEDTEGEGDIYRRDDFYSPRKRVKLDLNEDINVTEVSPSIHSSPARSHLFSSPVRSPDKDTSLFTPPGSTSPVKLVASRLPEDTSFRTSVDIHHDRNGDVALTILKQDCGIEEDDKAVYQNQSQDPLLLHPREKTGLSSDILSSPEPPLLFEEVHTPLPDIEHGTSSSNLLSSRNSPFTTPRSSQTFSLLRHSLSPDPMNLSDHSSKPNSRFSPSPDPLNLLDHPSKASSSQSHMIVDHYGSPSHTSQASGSRLNEPTLQLQTPTRPRTVSPISPLTPSPQARRQIPSPDSSRIAREPRPPTPGTHVTINARPYSLRPRNAAQIQPFTVEALRYRDTLKAAPDAIVKIRGVDDRVRSGHGSDRYEETQDDEYEDGEDRSQEEEEARILKKTKSKNKSSSPGVDIEMANYPSLEGLPSEDEEEEREMRKMSKEGRKVLKERERRLKERERKEREQQRQMKEQERKRAKAFPLGRIHSSRGIDNGSEDEEAPKKSNRLRSSISSEDVQDASLLPPITSSSRPLRSQLPYESENPAPDAADQHIMDYYGQEDRQAFHNDDAYTYRQDDLPVFEPDNDAQSTTSQPLYHHILRNTRETAIDISSEPEIDDDRSDKGSSSSSDHGSIELDPKQKRALGRMLPAFMANKLLAGGPSDARKNNMRHSIDRESEGTGPLRPGQTRVRRASNPRDIHEIRGDTENSSDDSDSSVRSEADDGIGRYHKVKKERMRSESEDDLEALEYRRFPGSHDVPEVISIPSDTSESEDEPEVLNDEDIQKYLKGKDDSYVASGRVKRMREANLVDWMLSRPRAVDSGKKKRKQDVARRSKGGTSSSKYKFDFISREGRRYGRENQTSLDFSNHKRKRQAEGFHPERRSRNSGRLGDRDDNAVPVRRKENDIHTTKDHIDQIPLDKEPTKSRRQLEKERKAKAKKQGLYTFASGGSSRLETGRQRGTAFVTVDLEDEGFHRALAPLRPKEYHRNWAEAFKPPPPDKKRHKHRKDPTVPVIGDDTHVQDHDTERHDKSNKKSKRKLSRRQIQGDLDIPVLHSGMRFHDDTFIGKGLLHELVNVIGSTKDPPKPSDIAIQGFELGPNMDITVFCEKLGNICDGLFEFATGLESATNPEISKEWIYLVRTLCRLLSWYIFSAAEAEKTNIREQVQVHILRLTANIREAALRSALLDDTFLLVCWLAVELSARLGIKPPSQTNSFQKKPPEESCAILVHHLLDYGLHRTMEPVRSENVAGSDISDYSAELWVSLIHVLDISSSDAVRAGKQIHPFWKVVLNAFKSGEYDDKPNIQVSESIWRAIFSLNALSQFSVRGMTTSTPRLPACWDLVILALKKIRLASDPEVDKWLDMTSLNKRDQYIGLITTRCFHLWDRWHWKLDNASSLFNHLVEIFKSRQFANLRHEQADYPLFMRHRNWDLLSSYSNEDTAYIQFLKLIYHSANIDGPLDAKGELKPKCKKLISLAIPVGELSFTKASPPTRDDLSSLFNRFSALAIAIHLDPGSCNTRISKARSYVNFKDVDDITRFGIMSGIVSFGILLAKSKIKLDAIAEWIGELSSALADEMKKVSGGPEDEHSPSTLHLFLSAQMLIATVRQIIDALKECKEYPEHSLLVNLKPIFRHFSEVPKVAEEIRALTVSYLTARSSVVPPPQRPQRIKATSDTEHETQESQEYSAGNFSDFDFDDPSLISALDGVAPEDTVSEADKTLRKAISMTNLQWLCFRFAKQYFPDPPPGVSLASYAEECDRWLSCWLGCANVDRCGGNERAWQICLGMRQSTWGKESTQPTQHWQRRIDLGVMAKILEFDPMAYESLTPKVIGIVLESLVADFITIEGTFVALVFSLDQLKHPLFRDATCVSREDDEDFHFSKEEFEVLRIPLIQVAFENLNRRIYGDNGIDPTFTAENQEFVGMFIQMFSVMKAIVEKLKERNAEDHRKYVEFCREIFQISQQNRALRSDERLLFWWSWGRTLE